MVSCWISPFLALTVSVLFFATTTCGIHTVDAASSPGIFEARQGNSANLHPPIRCWGDSQTSTEMFDGNVVMTPKEILDHLSGSSCGLCDPRRAVRSNQSSSSSSTMDERYHALLVLPDNAPEFVPLATGLLLTNRFRLTILRLHFEREDPNGTPTFNKHNGQAVDEKLREMHEKILTGIPCDHPVRTIDDASYVLEVNFSFKEQNRFSIGEKICHGPLSLHPFDECAIQAAPATALLIKNYVPLADQKTSPIGSSLPDVLITDASLVGSMWMGEAWGIPTVTVATPAFVPLAVEHDAAWTSQIGGLWVRIWGMFRQRFHSLSITKAYMMMNKMRLEFGLPPLKKPIDYLGTVAAILMEFAKKDSIPGVDATKAQDTFSETTEHWERVHVVGPLQPPCIPCEPQVQISHPSKFQAAFRDKQASNKRYQPPTVVVAPPSVPTPTSTRNILQGLLMAQQSLEQYDDCDWDSLSCQKPYDNFQIVWLYDDDHDADDRENFLPPIPVESMELEPYTNMLDTISRYPKTVLTLMPCDRNAAIFENTLDLSVICLEDTGRFPLKPEQMPPSATEPRELAARILRLLRARQQKKQRPSLKVSSNSTRSASAQGSLTRSVSIIERVAQTHREHFPWKNTAEMQIITSQAVKNLTQQDSNVSSADAQREANYDWHPPYDTFTVFVAWIVLIVSMLYIAIKDVVFSKSTRRNHGHYNSHHIPFASSDGLFARPDLDDAWAAWLEWYQEQPDSIRLLYQNIVRGIFGESSSNHSSPRHGVASPSSTNAARKRKKR